MTIDAAAAFETTTLVYDGDCGVCEQFADWARARIPAWRFVPATNVSDAALVSVGLSRAACQDAVQLVCGGTVKPGAAAINAVLVAARHPLRHAVRLIERVPPLFFLERLGYALVASHRGALSRFAGVRSCRLP